MEEMGERLERMEARLTTAERSARRWRGVAYGAALAAVIGTGIGAAGAGQRGTVIRAPLSVVDANGKQLMRLDASLGGPILRIYNPQDKVVIDLRGSETGGMLGLSASKGGRGVGIAAEETISTVSLVRHGARPSVFIADTGKESAFALQSPTGRGGIRASVNDTGQAIKITDRSGRDITLPDDLP